MSIATTETDHKLAGLDPARLSTGPTARLDRAIASHFESSASRRTYIMTDKPLYQPGESIWFRVDLRATQTLIGGPPVGVTMQLESPRGAVVAQKRVLVQSGVGKNDFALGPAIPGGEYTLRLTADDGTHDAKKIVINTYEAPRLTKSLELLRKAYGEGDHVTAAIEIKRSTGEPFATKPVTAVVTLDDAETSRQTITTDASGKAMVAFDLPAKIARGDGLLTILVDDGGVTESTQKRIPIVMKTLSVSVFPEGGDLVLGVPGRVYFMATTTLGKPADIEGRVVDDGGTQVGTLSSIHDGMGKFELTPRDGRRYHIELDKPAGITTRFDVPAAKPRGCVVRSVDQTSAASLRVAAICASTQTVLVEAVLRENRLASGAFEVVAGKPVLVDLPVDPSAQGAVRVTLFTDKQQPLAERLVYHAMGVGLKITVTADRKAYTPRDPVKLHVHATDAQGSPVRASFGVAVADNTVLSFADDKSAKLLAHVFLDEELGGEPIEEPNYYFATTPAAALAMDALLATRGYRRFEWQTIAGGQP
ncbi:MAG TPA: MG2 domain-containing protein [Kofleriaceae bacterium]|nr:MG2 domain-containing protein [Kofleriaceae bacterium]